MIKYKYNGIEYNSLNDIKLLFPNVSFPQTPLTEDLLPMGITQENIEDTPIIIPTKTDAELLAEAQTATISMLKALLTQTDYEAIKYAEGITTATQYANLKAAREAWRTAINSIQAATIVDDVNAVTYSTTIPNVD